MWHCRNWTWYMTHVVESERFLDKNHWVIRLCYFIILSLKQAALFSQNTANFQTWKGLKWNLWWRNKLNLTKFRAAKVSPQAMIILQDHAHILLHVLGFAQGQTHPQNLNSLPGQLKDELNEQHPQSEPILVSRTYKFVSNPINLENPCLKWFVSKS